MKVNLNYLLMNREQLARETQKLAKNVNRRYDTLAKHGGYSPAYKNLEASGGKIYTRGKSLNELRYEYARGAHFLGLKTSTLRGFSQVNKELAQRLGFKKLTQEQINNLWTAYNKLDETHFFEVRRDYGSNQVQQDIAKQIVDGTDPDTVIQNMLNKMESRYIETQKQRALLNVDPLDLV